MDAFKLDASLTLTSKAKNNSSFLASLVFPRLMGKVSDEHRHEMKITLHVTKENELTFNEDSI